MGHERAVSEYPIFQIWEQETRSSNFLTPTARPGREVGLGRRSVDRRSVSIGPGRRCDVGVGNLLGEAVRGVEDLLRAAEEQTGSFEWGDDWFLRPLAAWVDDLASEHLNDDGRAFLTSLAIRDLCRRLKVIDTLVRHPEIDEVEIPPIVYISGTIRSGTTLAHNAMSVGYPTVVADPVAAAEASYFGLGFPADPGLTSRIELFLDAQRGGARVRPPRSLPHPGLPHDHVLERPPMRRSATTSVSSPNTCG